MEFPYQLFLPLRGLRNFGQKCWPESSFTFNAVTVVQIQKHHSKKDLKEKYFSPEVLCRRSEFGLNYGAA